MSGKTIRACKTCSKAFAVYLNTGRPRAGQYCSRACMHARRRAAAERPDRVQRRFWSKVNKQGPAVSDALGPCWIWTASLDINGYGQFRYRGGGATTVKAHRMAWELSRGALDPKLAVLHTCDTPACVNPAHLFLGTQIDNMIDMAQKRRGKVRLNAAMVTRIRKQHAAGASKASLAREYSVSFGTIKAVVTGKSWQFV